MTLPDINQKISDLIGDPNSVAYPSTSRIIDVNIWNQKITGMILDSMDEEDYDDIRRTDYPVKTISLTTNRDYPIPQTEKVLKIKSVSVAYDGTNYYRATPLDSNEIQDLSIALPSSASTANTNLDNRFSRTSPRYDVKYNSIWLYPAATSADVTSGGKMIVEWYRQPLDFSVGDFSNTTTIPGFDDTFHAMLAYGPAFEYATAKQLPQLKSIAATLADYEARLRTQYSSKQKDRVYSLQSDYQNYK